MFEDFEQLEDFILKYIKRLDDYLVKECGRVIPLKKINKKLLGDKKKIYNLKIIWV